MTKVRVAHNTPIPLTARQALELSTLQLSQLQLMGPNVDLDAFKIAVKSVVPLNLIENVTDARIDRTTDGASTLEVDVNDTKRQLLRSGLLGSKQDVKIDGLWFRLKQVKKNDDTLTLVFEDREIAVLRTYAQPIKMSPATSRSKITRAQFVLRLIREVKEFKIPVSIPELKIKQQIGAATLASPDALTAYNQLHRSLGIGSSTGLTVKGQPISTDQLKNANAILDTASSALYARPVMVMAIMCAIQESSIQNLPPPLPGAGNYISAIPGDNPVGVFQQRKRMGWPATRDVATDAAEFLKRLAALYATNHGSQYYTLIEDVQHSGQPQAYAQWRTEAERIVNAYGAPSSSILEANHSKVSTFAGSGDYEFYRGIPPVQGQSGWLPEDSWTCIQRLANEVNFRAFFVSGTFYYISDDDLFASSPRMRVTEGKDGVDVIDGDYDENKKLGTATVYCRVGRWAAPVGSVVATYDMGLWDGRWLVTEFSRSLFDDAAEISLAKPEPVLPEPISDSVNNLGGTFSTAFLDGTVKDSRSESRAAFGGVIPKDQLGSRAAIVTIAQRALDQEKTRHYAYPPDEGGDGSRAARPIPSSLWSDDAHAGLDCSAFATLVYKEAGMPDPNGNDYNGEGNTGTLYAHGIAVTVPKPGDLAFYGGTTAFPKHVAVFIGGGDVAVVAAGSGDVIEIGSANGISEYSVDYRSDLLGFVTYFPVGA